MSIDGYATALDDLQTDAPPEAGHGVERRGMPLQVAMQLLSWRKPPAPGTPVEDVPMGQSNMFDSPLRDEVLIDQPDFVTLLPNVSEFYATSEDEQNADGSETYEPRDRVEIEPEVVGRGNPGDDGEEAAAPFAAVLALLAAHLAARRRNLKRKSRLGGA